MRTLAERLRGERTRLSLKQDEMAAAAGLNRTAQIRYEKGERTPDSDYLAAIAAIGVDVLYVVTGIPAPTLRTDESELLRRYRNASSELKAAAMAVLGAAVIGEEKKGGGVNFNAGVEQANVTQGDVTHKAPVTFNVGGTKRGKKK